MSHYLPVLLVSVSANSSLSAVTDDSALETQARGQVDYLSHEWLEEDVWRSWRNMTRQKNEIANGVRLENASWRTWWKQRNKLSTISPETLNWLKDSDVTWLYGPLHTGVCWTPLPPPKSVPTSVHKSQPNSVHDRLGLTTPTPLHKPKRSLTGPSTTLGKAHKPILKHRSITELLTGDLPPSISSKLGLSPSDSPLVSDEDTGSNPKRPALSRTKSESGVNKWRSREPTFPSYKYLEHSALSHPSSHSYLTPHPHPTINQHSTDASNRLSTSSKVPSKASSPECGHGPGCARSHKKHIAFNTFVEQCIALDKPQTVSFNQGSDSDKTRARVGLGAYESTGQWNGKTKGLRWVATGDEDDEDQDGSGYDDDSGSSSSSGDPVAYFPFTDSDDGDLWYDENVFEDDDEDAEFPPEHIEDERHSRTVVPKTGHLSSPRSQSQTSTSSSSSNSTGASNESSSTTDTSPSPARKEEEAAPSLTRTRRRSRRSAPEGMVIPRHRLSNSSQSSNATIVQRRHLQAAAAVGRRSSQTQHQAVNHVSIAPIAPTRLKAVGVGNEWDSFGTGFGYHRPYSEGSWVDGFGDEGYSDDGGSGRWLSSDVRSRTDSEDEAEKPVELVYVPSGGYDGLLRKDSQNQRKRRSRTGSPNEPIVEESHFTSATLPAQPTAYLGLDASAPVSTVSIIVRTPPAIGSTLMEEDAYDCFAGPDLGEDFISPPTPRRRRNESRTSPQAGVSQSGEVEEERRGRSRSRSRSRTPSPQVLTSGVSSPIPVLSSSRGSSPSSSSSATHLSPPSRGRSAVPQQDQPVSRGRSAARTSSSSFSDRERSSQSSSLGSLSPDGVVVASTAYGAFGSGGTDREPRRRDRLRERADRKLTHSLSPESLSGAAMAVSTSGVDSAFSSSASQSNSATRPTSSSPPARNDGKILALAEKPSEPRLEPPTPANSPVVGFSTNVTKPPTTTNSRDRPLRVSPKQLTTPLGASPVLSSSPIHPPPSPTRAHGRHSSVTLLQSNAAMMDTTNETIVGRAVGMVSSAGVYLGLWQGEDPQ